MTTRHIVVPTDLSDGSAASFARVGALAADLGARVTLLYVLQEPMAVPYGYPYVPEPTLAERTEYLARLDTRLEEFVSQFPSGVKVEHKVLETTQPVDQAICEFAHENAADAIAMATHGYSGLRRWFLGSVAEHVVRGSHVPVFLYPPTGD